MDDDMALVTTGSTLLLLAVVAVAAWFGYRALRRRPRRARIDSQSNYARERWLSTRHQR